jgi:hypothetical protein
MPFKLRDSENLTIIPATGTWGDHICVRNGWPGHPKEQKFRVCQGELVPAHPFSRMPVDIKATSDHDSSHSTIRSAGSGARFPAFQCPGPTVFQPRFLEGKWDEARRKIWLLPCSVLPSPAPRWWIPQFEDVACAEKAILAMNNFQMAGKKLVVKSADADTDEKPSNVESDNLYVKGLPLNMSQEQLHTMFAKYGNVSQLKILSHPGLGSTGEVRRTNEHCVPVPRWLNLPVARVNSKAEPSASSQPIHPRPEDGVT